MQEMQQAVTHLQQAHGGRIVHPASRDDATVSAPTSAGDNDAGGSRGDDLKLRNQIATLKSEVERLQGQMEQMRRRDLEDESPPDYQSNVN